MSPSVRLWLFDDQRSRALPPRSTVDETEARRRNRQGMGVFWCPNLPRADVRRIDRLAAVRYAYADLDGLEGRSDKRAALDRLESSPCAPCRVVETRSGLHAYWRIDDLTLAAWDAVVRHRLIPFFNADPRAADPVRVLRVPGFLHMKRPDDPYPVATVSRTDARHSVAQILDAFPEVRRAARPSPAPRLIPFGDSDDIITAVGNLDARDALVRLSGSTLCRGEIFTFVPTSRGRWNILVGAKATSCFVDEHGRIGSSSGGGPTAIQWIGWYYGRAVTASDWRAIADELRRIFPELVKGASPCGVTPT